VVISVLKQLPTVAAAISFSILTAAFVHEWAFFYVIGVQYQAFMSVTDYFNSAVSWLPWAVVATAAGGLLAVTDPVRHIPKEFYEAHPWRWYWDHGGYTFLGGMLVLAGLVQFLFGSWYARPGAMEILFMFVWFKPVQNHLLREKKFATLQHRSFEPSTDAIVLVLGVPVALFIVFMGGLQEGAAALSSKEPVYYARLKKEYRENSWFVLRNLSSGAIVRELGSDRIQYVKWDDVAVFQSKIAPLNKNGLICRITGYACKTGIYQ
jgi:hypothetical protein